MRVLSRRRCAVIVLPLVAMLGSSTALALENIVPIEVRQAPFGRINVPYVDVTVCNAAKMCRTVSHVVVDTGSSGLILSSGELGMFLLDPVRDVDGRPLAHFTHFWSGAIWGELYSAQVSLGDVATTQAIPITVFGPPRRYERLPAGYSQIDARDLFLSVGNGILGIAPRRYHPHGYYARDASGALDSGSDWVPVQVDTTRQVVNPIVHFPAPYDNGSVIKLPMVDWAEGEEQVRGWLGLGIGAPTEELFPPGARRISHELDESITFPVKLGERLIKVEADSGTNTLRLDLRHLGIPSPRPHSEFYDVSALTPLPLKSISDGKEIELARRLFIGPAANEAKILDLSYAVLPMLVIPPSSPIVPQVLGLPFFYGRSVATGLEGTVNPLRSAAQAASDKQESRQGLGEDGASLVLDAHDDPIAGPAPSPHGFIIYTDGPAGPEDSSV